MTEIAPYYLSVEQTDLTQRRAGWARKKRNDFQPDVTFIGTDQSPQDPPGGLIARIDANGAISAQLPIWGVEGICHGPDNTLLAAGPWAIWQVDKDLTVSQLWLSAPWCNYLHTLRPTKDSLIVASTGADAIFDVAISGTRVLWSWWAEHGGFYRHQEPNPSVQFPVDELRGYKIDTLLQYAHLNSAIQWCDEVVLATLFHQGALVQIERKSKHHKVLISGLHRPHAIRQVDTKRISIANTGSGEALLITLGQNGERHMASRVKIDTPWLQDALWTPSGWMLVDGANARVIHCTHDGTVRRIDSFDPDWRLFEVLPIPSLSVPHSGFTF